MIHNQDPKTFITDDTVENNGSYNDDRRLVNPRNWGDDDEIDEDDIDEDDWFNEQNY